MEQLLYFQKLLPTSNSLTSLVATPTPTGQAPNRFDSNPNHLLPHMQAPPQLHVASTPAFPSLPSTPSPTRFPTLTPLSVFPAHLPPTHSLPASAHPSLSTSQLPNAYQLHTKPTPHYTSTMPGQQDTSSQIFELLNLIQMVHRQNLPREPEAPSSTQSPVSRVIHAESSSQTEGPSFAERAVSPTPPFGILSMEEEMLNLKKEMEQLQKMYDNDVKKFELNRRQMSEGHQEKVTKMSEMMKLLEDDFKKLSSADKKIIGDLKFAESQQDAKIDALVQKNKKLETENKQMACMNWEMSREMCVRDLEFLALRVEIGVLTNGETKKIVQLIDENVMLQQEIKTLESDNEKKNQEILRMQCELAAKTEEIQAQEEELQELRDFKIKAEADKKEAQRQLEMTHSNVVTANLPLKKSESPAYNPGFEDDGYLHEETVYTEMPEEIAKMPKEEKFSEVLEKQKDDNEIELMENRSPGVLRQEILVLHGHIKQFKKKLETLRSEFSTLEEKTSMMRSSFQRLQFLTDAKEAEVEDLQRKAKRFSDPNEHQQKLETCQRMLKIYEDHSEKVVIFNNGRFYWRRKHGQSGTSDQVRAAKRPRQ